MNAHYHATHLKPHRRRERRLYVHVVRWGVLSSPYHMFRTLQASNLNESTIVKVRTFHQARLTLCLLDALPLRYNSLRFTPKQRTTPLCTCGEVGYTPLPLPLVQNTSSVQIQRIYDSERVSFVSYPLRVDAPRVYPTSYAR